MDFRFFLFLNLCAESLLHSLFWYICSSALCLYPPALLEFLVLVHLFCCFHGHSSACHLCRELEHLTKANKVSILGANFKTSLVSLMQILVAIKSKTSFQQLAYMSIGVCMPFSNELSCLKEVKYKMYEQRQLNLVHLGEQWSQQRAFQLIKRVVLAVPLTSLEVEECFKSVSENPSDKGCLHCDWCFGGIVFIKLCVCGQTPVFQGRIGELKEKRLPIYSLRYDFTETNIFVVILHYLKLNIIAPVKATLENIFPKSGCFCDFFWVVIWFILFIKKKLKLENAATY